MDPSEPLSMIANAGFLEFFIPLCALGIVLTLIDIRHGIIPDWLNAAIAGLGLFRAVLSGGAIAGLSALGEGLIVGLIFWLLRRLYFHLRHTQGLGLGDVKFLAAAGIWTGLAGLPFLLLLAASTALAAAGFLHLAGGRLTARTSIPFGPFLAFGLVALLALQRVFDIL